jgi:TatD DNase family protein
MNRRYNDDRDQVIEKAVSNGVSKMIITGTNVKNSESAADFATRYPDILFSTAGIHPHDARHFNRKAIGKLEKLLDLPHVVAVGECGLDYNRVFSSKEDQKKCFEAQLELARKTGKPLFLHEREAHTDFVDIMKENKDLIPRSVVHCFTGNEEQLKCYLWMGFYIGITGWICDERRGKELQQVVKHIPLNRLLIETDGPFLTPRTLKPRPKNDRNEPAFLPHIAEHLAKYMNVSVEEIADHSTKNAETLFKI